MVSRFSEDRRFITSFTHILKLTILLLGVALNDSPVGLLAYILEKFSTWTNPAFIELADGGLERSYCFLFIVAQFASSLTKNYGLKIIVFNV